jgi:hypothetical protein
MRFMVQIRVILEAIFCLYEFFEIVLNEVVV